jgi:hypothetical protein
MERVGEETSAFPDYEIKKTQVFPVVADRFSGRGDSKKGGNYGDSGFFASHQRIGFHIG